MNKKLTLYCIIFLFFICVSSYIVIAKINDQEEYTGKLKPSVHKVFDLENIKKQVIPQVPKKENVEEAGKKVIDSIIPVLPKTPIDEDDDFVINPKMITSPSQPSGIEEGIEEYNLIPIE